MTKQELQQINGGGCLPGEFGFQIGTVFLGRPMIGLIDPYPEPTDIPRPGQDRRGNPNC